VPSSRPRSRRRSIAAWVVTAVAVALLLGFAGLVTSYEVYAVRTGSMQPTIPSRSAVVVDPGTYRVGQVISFVHRGEVITHRLVAEDAAGRLTTQGDANDRPDPWQLRRADVIGGVVAAPRFLGYWLVYLRNPAGSGSLLFGTLSIWVSWGLTSRPGGVTRAGSRPAGPSPTSIAA
jgi:signal peptidase